MQSCSLSIYCVEFVAVSKTSWTTKNKAKLIPLHKVKQNYWTFVNSAISLDSDKPVCFLND